MYSQWCLDDFDFFWHFADDSDFGVTSTCNSRSGNLDIVCVQCMLLTMTMHVTDNDNVLYIDNDNACYWQWQCILLTMTIHVTDNDNACYWQWHCMSLTMTMYFIDNDNACYWQWQCMLLTMTMHFIDYDNACYWQWQCIFFPNVATYETI